MLYSTNDNQEQQVATLDEIRQHIDGRYVSSSEALWRIYGFSMNLELPAVCQLAIHLHMPQAVYLSQNMTAGEALAAVRISEETTPTPFFFRINASDELARQTRYQDFPLSFTLNQSTKTWNRRRNRTGLLCISKRPRMNAENADFAQNRFEFLGNGELCSTFQEAYVKLNLIVNNDEYDRDMRDA